MSLNISNVLNCDTIFDENQLTIITSDDINNSAFIIDTLLHSIDLKVKKNDEVKVFLILINQSWLNYSIRLTRRFGVNLKYLSQLNCLEVLDFLSEYDDYFKSDEFDWNRLKQNIFTKMYSLFNSFESKRIMIIDDLTCLLNFISIKNLYLFILSLRSVCFQLKVSLIIQSFFDYDDQDEEVNKIVYSLIYCGQEWIEVKKLKTGYSFKIDGHLTIYTYKNFNPVEKASYQFKHSDRMIKIFPIGYQF